MAEAEKPGRAAAFGFVGVDRKRFVIRPPGCATCHVQPPIERPIPGVDHVEDQRHMDADGRMQAIRRLPGPVAHSRHPFPTVPAGCSGSTAAVARDDISRIGQAADFDFQPLQRRVDVADRAAAAGLFAQHMPRLDRVPQFQVHRLARHAADLRKAKLEVRHEPVQLEGVAGLPQIVDDFGEILPHEMRQHEPVVQNRPPAGQRVFIGLFQNRAIKPRSNNCCTRLICGCGGISKPRSSTSPSRPDAESGEYSLSMQNSARCVLPVTSISRCRNNRSTSQGGQG